MKVFKILFIAGILTLTGSQDSSAQDSKFKTEEFKVNGVCSQCKARIENAAYIKGVKHVEWNKETEILSVVYKVNKVDPDAIQKSVADAGHDTDKYPAPQEAYDKLPKCCAYKGGVDKH